MRIRYAKLMAAGTVTLGLTVAGCSSSAPPHTGATSSQPSSAAKLSGKTVGVVELYSNPFWSDALAGIKKVANPLGVKVTAVNSNGNAATQSSNVTQLSSAQVDAAIIGPVAPAGALSDINRLKQSGATVYCLDSCAAPAAAKTATLGWVSTSGASLGNGAGKAAADYIQQKLGGKATIAMVVCDSLGPVCSTRHDAITKQLHAVPGAKVVATQDAFETQDAEPKVADMLTAHPDVNVVITNNQGGTEGAVAAIKRLHLEGKVVVFGIDMTNVIAQDLLDTPPVLMYTVAQNSYKEGVIAMQSIVDKWSGKNPKSNFPTLVPAVQYTRSDTAAIKAYMSSHKGQ